MAERIIVFLNEYGYPESASPTGDSTTLSQVTISGGPILSNAGISMGDKSLTGIDNISFTDVSGQIAGIENQNLVDKSAAESIAGTWTFNQIDFAAVDDTIAGIENQNLLDKTAAETISGAWIYSNDISFSSGTVSVAGIQNQNLVDKSAGESITGAWSFGILPTSNATPSNQNDLVTKNYADNLISGIDAKESSKCATIGALTGTGLAYATDSITWTASNGPTAIDGVTLNNGDRILVKDETDGAGTLNAEHNGLYVRVSQDQWDRSTDADTWAKMVSAFTFVEEGSNNAETGWVCSADAGGTLGTTDIVWVQFSSAGVRTPGFGLGQTGSVWWVDSSDLVSGDFGLESNGVDGTETLRINLAVSSGLQFNTGLEIDIDGTTLSKDAAGLKVASEGITDNEMDSDGNFTMTGRWEITGEFQLPTSASASPEDGDIYWSAGALYGYDGVNTDWIKIGSGTGSIDATGGEAGGISDGDVVYISAASTVKKAIASSWSTCEATIGFSNESIASAASGTIITSGVKEKAGWSLTPGDLYYLDDDTAGGITNSYANLDSGDWIVTVGRAFSATEMIVDIDVIGRK